MTTTDDVREQVRLRYAAAAKAVRTQAGPRWQSWMAISVGVTGPPDQRRTWGRRGRCSLGAGLYSVAEQDELPVEALMASLGCGNPIAVADLHPGEQC